MIEKMSTIGDSERRLYERIASERSKRDWTLGNLADRSGVSRSMLSKIERCEVSATATVLLKIASGFGLTLANLLDEQREVNSRYLKAADQPTWTDPLSGYVRRQIYFSHEVPMELVEVELPAGAYVAVPAASLKFIRQALWVLRGAVTITEGEAHITLRKGDRWEFASSSDVLYENPGEHPCKYIVAVLRLRAPANP